MANSRIELGALLSSHRGRLDNGLGGIALVFGLLGVVVLVLPLVVTRRVPGWVMLSGAGLLVLGIYLGFFSGRDGSARRFDAFENGFCFSDGGAVSIACLWRDVKRVEMITRRRAGGLLGLGREESVALVYGLVTPYGQADVDVTMESFAALVPILRDKINPLLPRA